VAPDRRCEFESQLLRLLDTYGRALHRLCAVYLQDAADQQDLYQEIAAALWSALPNFRGDSSERTWLYRVAHNVAYTYANKRRRQYHAEQQMDALVGDPSVPEDPRRSVLLEAIRYLDSVDRQVVLLYLEGLSAREIEDVTGLSANSVNVRLSRTRRKMASIVVGKEVGE